MLIRLSTIWIAIFVIALLSSNITDDELRLNIIENGQLVNVAQQSSDFVQIQSDNDYDNDNLARINLPQTFLFNHEQQNSPSYFLISEGIVNKLVARFFKNLVNPPKALPWYCQISCNTSSRISGWKDSNNLYTASVTYHS